MPRRYDALAPTASPKWRNFSPARNLARGGGGGLLGRAALRQAKPPRTRGRKLRRNSANQQPIPRSLQEALSGIGLGPLVRY